jgi:hypothetical protein
MLHQYRIGMMDSGPKFKKMLIRYRTDMMDVPNADDGGIGLDADAQL